MASPRVAILAGELSGDVLGAGLMRELRRRSPGVQFEGIGGPAMAAEGLESLVPMERLSLMGVTEIVRHLPGLLRLRADLARRWREAPPDCFIGVDLPDFNLGLERRLRAAGIPTVHYVSPTIWAWRPGRVKGVRQSVDRMLTLYPFEEKFYAESGVDAVCVGHPAADRYPMQPDTGAARRTLGLAEDATVVALLPGSRSSEIDRLLEPFLGAAALLAQRPDAPDFVIPVAAPRLRERIEAAVARHDIRLRTRLLEGDTATAVTAADVALTASGTATLEVMLAKRPMVVAYRLSPLSYQIIRRLIRVPWVSQPNLLAGEPLVPEYFQSDVDPQILAEAAAYWLDDAPARLQLVGRFRHLHETLARGADARAAEAVLEVLQ
ncbi:lipid-A-disaccharide synthase [Halorhodospira halophila]|uniref:Lipid-A-disaccharide synthase n=1 Tax=Halorhodospira halophila (strain DSM 244 / SL1) TaxID=349124 RepID=A1WX10_HALHL|nr:lipid-A-disaccharide synthase [Halorhodospira halophila]ABM62222.1 lipid-A-disaccharide synthase [Halorhodospira halophila SL1]MBK1729197.1 lipid-A-disaccharide synthase [Halorhodospira halophila]